MSRTVITERHIDQMYTVIETLSLCSIVLADGNITEKTASSISWLTGQMKEEVYQILTLVEGLHAAQKNGGRCNG